MTATVGSYALGLGLLSAIAAAMAAVVSAGQDRPGLLRASRGLLGVFAACVSVAMATLWVALVNSDFSVAYVVSYTERALPVGYKLAALWAGQEGSLLLWAWLLGVISVAVAWAHRRETGVEAAATLATLAVVGGFFAAVLVFAADPFKVLPTPATPEVDGHGLNPLLQHPSMVAHPPLLFIGYAGFTAPFAMLVGALAAGRRDNAWIGQTRRWLIFSWLFLTVGIMLGAQWAYEELGWGGYWAWDPVENASLLPWLTATAAIHSISFQRQRGVFKVWNALLLAGTFILCIFATYLTRSGVIQSVHAFGASLIGTFFLVFLSVSVAVTAALVVWRRRTLSPEHKLADLGVKARAFLAANILLVIATGVTLIGTTFPLISSVFSARPITVASSFYNTVVGPIAVLLLAVMAFGPMLRENGHGWPHLRRHAKLPAIVAAFAVAGVALTTTFNLWALASTGICAFAVTAVAGDFLARLRAEREQHTGRSVLGMIDGNHARYGGQLAHMGMVMILVGVVGSSLFNTKATLQMKPGEPATVGRYTLIYHDLVKERGANFTAMQAHIGVAGGGPFRGRAFTLHPQVRFYDKSIDAHAEVALSSTLSDDFYLTLAGWEDGGNIIAVQVVVNPLVAWLWIGGLTLTAGGVLAWLPRLLPRPAGAPAPAPAPAVGGQLPGAAAARVRTNDLVEVQS
jgi:cytochrome c-type biogenesis protein CcmF